MGDFYKNRKDAFKEVATMYANGATKGEMVYKISVAYGFSIRFVEDAIKTLEAVKNKE